MKAPATRRTSRPTHHTTRTTRTQQFSYLSCLLTLISLINYSQLHIQSNNLCPGVAARQGSLRTRLTWLSPTATTAVHVVIRLTCRIATRIYCLLLASRGRGVQGRGVQRKGCVGEGCVWERGGPATCHSLHTGVPVYTVNIQPSEHSTKVY